MRTTTAIVGFAFVMAALIHAQTAQTDEQQIRAVIAKWDAGRRGLYTTDPVLWSGAYKRPTIGFLEREEIPTERPPSERVPGTQRYQTTPVRIEVAESGDMAYEFSNTELSFDLKSGKKESFPASFLRVWKKEAGQWKIAAQFSRPHYQEPAKK
jgi:hypothetical protein